MLASTVLMLALAMQPPTVESQPPEPAPQTQAAPPDDQEHKAKEPPTPEHTGIRALFANLGEDITKLPAKQNLYLAATGGALALGAHPFDQSVNEYFVAHYEGANDAFFLGKYLGDTPEQVAMSLGTYAVGRIFKQPKTAHLG